MAGWKITASSCGTHARKKIRAWFFTRHTCMLKYRFLFHSPLPNFETPFFFFGSQTNLQTVSAVFFWILSRLNFRYLGPVFSFVFRAEYPSGFFGKISRSCLWRLRISRCQPYDEWDSGNIVSFVVSGDISENSEIERRCGPWEKGVSVGSISNEQPLCGRYEGGHFRIFLKSSIWAS